MYSAFSCVVFLWGGGGGGGGSDNCHVDVDNVQHQELVQFYGV